MHIYYSKIYDILHDASLLCESPGYHPGLEAVNGTIRKLLQLENHLEPTAFFPGGRSTTVQTLLSIKD